MVEVHSEAADCLGRRLAGFKVALLDLGVFLDFGPELFEEEVPEVFPCGVVNALVILALVPHILNVFEEVPPCIYDLQTVIAIGVWLGIKYLCEDLMPRDIKTPQQPFN